jgi:hypothetical protein
MVFEILTSLSEIIGDAEHWARLNCAPVVFEPEVVADGTLPGLKKGA